MKITDAGNAVIERSGLAAEGVFTIAFNSKMASILSNGLYSDKIQSIIREISANAVDSHVAAGRNDQPIEVHLPTTWEPWFHVRDFGIGLDHDQVVNIYTCYGASTKTNSNDFVGQLGLGSKSPFSYVDAFDVTARKAGVERQYSMYKSEDGMPSMALLGERPTTEPNGVTVKLPVKQEDMRRFSEKAAEVFAWYRVKPSMTGKNIDIPVFETAYQGTGWMIRKRGYGLGSSGRAVVVMGNVAYPIDAGSLPNLTIAQKAILEMPITLQFHIGDVEVAASREGLGYDNRTITNVIARLDMLLTELGGQFESRIATAKTEWAARQIFGELFGSESAFKYEFDRAFGHLGLKWQDKLIRAAHVTIDTKDIYNTTPGIWRADRHKKTARALRYDHTFSIRCSDDNLLVFDDLDKGAVSRVNYLHQTNGCRQDIWLFGAGEIKTRDEILAMLGNPPFKLASELPKKTIQRGEAIKMLVYRGTGEGAKAWLPADVDLDDGGLYVLLDRHKVTGSANLEIMLRMAKDFGIVPKSQQIYAARADMRRKIAAHKGWEEFFNLLRSAVTARLTTEVLQTAADLTEYHAVLAAFRDSSLWTYPLALQDHHGVFGTFVREMRRLEAGRVLQAQHQSLIALSQYCGTAVTLPRPSMDAKNLLRMIRDSYPMLSLAFDRMGGRSINSGNAGMFEDYINLCDTHSKIMMEQAVAA